MERRDAKKKGDHQRFVDLSIGRYWEKRGKMQNILRVDLFSNGTSLYNVLSSCIKNEKRELQREMYDVGVTQLNYLTSTSEKTY